ncbi:hypothetical protein IFR05_002072 [Cadophora sp. M221]|nr:hypothetical protein IFR05_002072 [Cadophora sp. M221]
MPDQGQKDKRLALGFNIPNWPVVIETKEKAVQVEEKIKDTLKVSRRDVKELEYENWRFVKLMAKRYGCVISVPDMGGNSTVDMCLTGSKEAVGKAKRDIKKWLILYSVPL